MIRSTCDKYGIPIIFDEVQPAFRRFGKMFACEHYDMVPDIMCLAKGINSGYMPHGATITTKEWISLAHLQPDRYWPKVCRELETGHLENDPKFNSIEARSKNAKELIAIMDEKFSTKNMNEWLKILKQEGCIFTPAQSPSEVDNDPQVLPNNYFIYVNHPVRDKTKGVAFSGTLAKTQVYGYGNPQNLDNMLRRYC